MKLTLDITRTIRALDSRQERGALSVTIVLVPANADEHNRALVFGRDVNIGAATLELDAGGQHTSVPLRLR
jgi:hypothetical protein